MDRSELSFSVSAPRNAGADLVDVAGWVFAGSHRPPDLALQDAVDDVSRRGRGLKAPSPRVQLMRRGPEFTLKVMLPYRVPVLCYGLLPESEPGFPARLAGAVGEFVAAHDMPDDAQLRPVVEAAGRALTSAKRGRLRR